MKLELNKHEVLSLYRLLITAHSVEPDVYDIESIKQKIEDQVLNALEPQMVTPMGVIDNLLDDWEDRVYERLAEKQAPETVVENKVVDMMEEYDSAYPKSFKRSRAGRRKNKK